MIVPDFSYEKSLIPDGTRYLLGIDEVGRGPWAGPVTIGAFLLDLAVFDPQQFVSLKIRDSKTLSHPQRLAAFQYFQKNGFRFQTFSAPAAVIDQQGIGRTITSLMLQALNSFTFDFALVDGNFDFSDHCSLFTNRYFSIPKADSLCFSVAAAAIVAKVARDQIMDDFHSQYPHYGFHLHKGYGTSAHLAALRQYGICPIHRLSYRPIKNLSSLSKFS